MEDSEVFLHLFKMLPALGTYKIQNHRGSGYNLLAGFILAVKYPQGVCHEPSAAILAQILFPVFKETSYLFPKCRAALVTSQRIDFKFQPGKADFT